MLSPSASVAIIVPMALWFSSPLNTESEVKTGTLSFKLLSLTVTSLFKTSIPSVTETINS